MPRSAIKGRKAETIRTITGYEAKTFNQDRAVLFVSCYGGKVRYEYLYRTMDEAVKAAREFNQQSDTFAHAELATPI